MVTLEVDVQALLRDDIADEINRLYRECLPTHNLQCDNGLTSHCRPRPLLPHVAAGYSGIFSETCSGVIPL
jgi:hypothetical protein